MGYIYSSGYLSNEHSRRVFWADCLDGQFMDFTVKFDAKQNLIVFDITQFLNDLYYVDDLGDVHTNSGFPVTTFLSPFCSNLNSLCEMTAKLGYDFEVYAKHGEGEHAAVYRISAAQVLLVGLNASIRQLLTTCCPQFGGLNA
jgi:hypothetical protein